VILSGQNNVTKCVFYPYISPDTESIVLSSEPKSKKISSYILWFVVTLIRSVFKLRKEFNGLDKKNTYVFVYGDTLSTLMGAVLAKLYGFKVVHVEGGYRSFNFFQPFPEEICRYLTSCMADVCFVAYDALLKNIAQRKCLKISTKYNPFIESLQFALKQDFETAFAKDMKDKHYFMLACHRQENIYNRGFMEALIKAVIDQSQKMSCLFILHEATEVALESYGLLAKIKAQPNIKIIPRVPYFDFIKLLGNAEFMLSDGGGNQQESYFWGKPLLILRNVTEGTEGIGENALLLKGDLTRIPYFMENYQSFKRPRVLFDESPSSIIVNYVKSL